MKKLGILLGVFGLFALVGVASASTADTLQPASTITYNEELVVNATGRFDSIYIGSTEAGVGGVTFFNGTIVNASVDEDGEDTIPVTFGDDVRVDGELYRTEVGGDNPIKLADSIRPQTTATYDLGMESYQFNDAYFAGDVSADTLTLTGALTGTTATLTGDLTGTTATFSGDVTAQGDVNQDLTDNGVVKAMVEIDGDAVDCLEKSWTTNDTTVTCTNNGAGDYTLTFDSTYDVDARYYSATVMDDIRITRAEAADNVVSVYSYDDGGTAANANIMFVVY